MPRLYAHPPRTRGAAVAVDSPWPARFLAAQVTQSLRHGLPASSRVGPLKALVARQQLPAGPLAAALQRPSRKPRPDLDALLTAACETLDLPAGASLLAVQRSAALTAFVFVDSVSPVVVLKIPAQGDDRVDREVAALDAAAPAGVTPKSLGRVGDARAQEGLPGGPLPVIPLRVSDAAGVVWDHRLQAVADGLAAIAAATRTDTHPHEVGGELFDAAVSSPDLSDSARRALQHASTRLSSLSTAVLKHSDTSAHNCLFDGDRLAGLIDWEMANPEGAPAFDILTTAVSYLEHGIGLRRWSEEIVVSSFRAAWLRAPLFAGAREAARASTLALGLEDADYEALEIACFARRLGRRVAQPERFATGAATAARMLEVVCAR